MSHVLRLLGCAPEPLMAYLKALGIFRLVAEQKDPGARAWWENDSFMLRSTLDKDALVEFFLEEYRPTPIVAPWNNRFRTGVMKGDKTGLDVILSSSEERFSDYRFSIEESKSLLGQEGFADRGIPGKGAEKNRILSRCRSLFSDEAVKWADAVYVLTHGEPAYPPLTSNGGTMGTSSSGDISMNFAKNLVEALGLRKRRRRDIPRPNDWLRASMFGDGRPKLSASAGGQFSPGGWGPNATVGFEADPLINPWDFLLLVEGTLAFAGAPVRRLTPESRSKAVFPFTVDASAAGYGTTASSEYVSARAEFWAPLWDRPSTLGELLHVATEGRSQLGRRQATNGSGFARAIAGLGIERGVSSFQRFGFLQRTGRDAVFAAPIGRLAVKVQPKSNLLFDLDTWMRVLRVLQGQAKSQDAPAGLGTGLRQVEDAIIEFCQRGGPRDLQDVLIAVGRAERWLSRSNLSNDNDKGRGVLNSLSREWPRHADDGAVEFRLAQAIASILPEPAQGKPVVGPVRWNLEPVAPDLKAGCLEWKKDSTSFVWTAGDAYSNMLAVLERRCLEGRMKSLDRPPLESAYSASLDDVVAFLNGEADAQRVVDLALPLSFVRYGRHKGDSQPRNPFEAPIDLPAAYAVMKLTLLTCNFVCPEFGVDGDGIRIAMEPSMLVMLRAGRVEAAYQVACRRLRASGLRPLSAAAGISDREQGLRLAAALLFPLDMRNHKALAERALRRPDRLDTQ